MGQKGKRFFPLPETFTRQWHCAKGTNKQILNEVSFFNKCKFNKTILVCKFSTKYEYAETN